MAGQTGRPGRNPGLERLDALVGEWTIEAGPPGGPPWPGGAKASFEWLEGRTFLIQRWTIDVPEAPDGIAIIGAADEPERFASTTSTPAASTGSTR